MAFYTLAQKHIIIKKKEKIRQNFRKNAYVTGTGLRNQPRRKINNLLRENFPAAIYRLPKKQNIFPLLLPNLLIALSGSIISNVLGVACAAYR
ncbi:MAG: hypothetical protein MUO63_00860 [Desulfobulbaceae bacterium]|nr:hypothetical protein [Desulfobulbaceae bacterium]